MRNLQKNNNASDFGITKFKCKQICTWFCNCKIKCRKSTLDFVITKSGADFYTWFCNCKIKCTIFCTWICNCKIKCRFFYTLFCNYKIKCIIDFLQISQNLFKLQWTMQQINNKMIKHAYKHKQHCLKLAGKCLKPLKTNV